MLTQFVHDPVDPRVPRSYWFSSSAPAQLAPLASASDTRINDYSGTSAEDRSGPDQSIDDNNDSNTGPGTRSDGSVPETNAPPSYASQQLKQC